LYGEAYGIGFSRTMQFIQARGATRERAEEIAQAAWSRGWERLPQLREDGMIQFWVRAIALNEFRRSYRKHRLEVELEDTCGPAGVDDAPIDAATILSNCSPNDKVLLEHQLHGLTSAEIAAEIGATNTAVRIRLHRARRAARAFVRGHRMPPTEEVPPLQGAASASN